MADGERASDCTACASGSSRTEPPRDRRGARARHRAGHDAPRAKCCVHGAFPPSQSGDEPSESARAGSLSTIVHH